jgi:hypothetical protein
VVDRVETTATVWLGLTVGCARCHDHKYDPITQKEFYQKNDKPAFAPGRIGQAAAFNGKGYLDLGDVGPFGFYDKFALGAWVYLDGDKGGTILSRMQDNDRSEGYSLSVEKGAVHFNLVKRWLDDSLRVQTVAKLKPGQWIHVLATYDGSRTANGVAIYLNGQPQKLKINLDDLNQNFRTKAPLKVGSGAGAEKRFHGRIDDVRLYERCLSPEEVGLVATTESIEEIVSLAPEKRTPVQSYKLGTYFLRHHAPRKIQKAFQHLQELRAEWEKLDATIPTVMIMQEMEPPRETFLLIRGEYDKQGEKVQRSLPASLFPMPKNAPNNRLGFAKWLVDPAHPLTARVAVNRFWQMYFGNGLVKTGEDFGSQGEWPSHPELLDWLATEFIRSGWDVKALQKLIVTSATYRQSSALTKNLLKHDPENRLLARGPRLRLPAHSIRDQALFVSGLLVEKQGGPSVKIYQPEGLWQDLADLNYVADKGEKLYRRSLYIFWKRTIAPPAMMTFDAAGRESCVVRGSQTNTPLQALNLLNDITYVEAARVLGERMMTQGGNDPEKRIAFAFYLATSRSPTAAELQILRAGFARHLQHYQNDRQAALKLVSVGEAPRNPALDVSELAAYMAVAGVILNLDETITKP